MNLFTNCPVCDKFLFNDYCDNHCFNIYYAPPLHEEVASYWFKQMINDIQYRLVSNSYCNFTSIFANSITETLASPEIIKLNYYFPFKLDNFKLLIPKLLNLRAFS